jgi:hypothetical protein
MKISISMGHYSLSLDYQDLEDAYNSALRIYKILVDTSSVTVVEVIPFENSYSFTNTDEKVKENVSGTAQYLESFVDDVTIKFSSGKMYVVGSLTDYVSKRLGGIFASAITVTGIITATGGTSTAWNIASAHSSLTSGNPHSVTPTELGLVIGTNVLAYDAFLTSITALGTAADKMLYTTAINTAAEVATLAYGRSILNTVDAAALRILAGVVIGTNVLAQQSIGIEDNNLVEIDGTPALGEYALFTANGLNGITGANLAAAIIGNISHNSLAALNVGDYLHLSAVQKVIAITPASVAQSGYLLSSDWSIFNGKQATMLAGNGITISANTIIAKELEIDHNALNNYNAINHRIINDSGTSLTELWSASKINGLLTSSVSTYVINFDATGSGELTSRIITTVPSGWVVDDSLTVSYGFGLGVLATSLTIQHDKTKHGQVWVMINSGGVYTYAEGNIAFSSMKESSDLNAIELVGFCTTDQLLEVIVII